MNKQVVRRQPINRAVCALFFFALLSCGIGVAQTRSRIVWYNVENLFDTIDNPQTNDEAFLPTSKLAWDEEKYGTKVKNLGRVLTAVGEWSTPGIIGLAEIENRTVVEDLLARTPALRRVPYSIAVTRGRDPRGINVALIWDTRLFKAISLREIPNRALPKASGLQVYPIGGTPKDSKSRCMLWATLINKRSVRPDTLDIFVVHAPSRRGGIHASEPHRVQAMQQLRAVVQSLFDGRRANPKIIIMGDFNDSPTDKALAQTLGAQTFWHRDDQTDPLQLYNLADLHEKQHRGSHAFKRTFWMPDQMIASGLLINNPDGSGFKQRNVHIFSPRFMRVGSGAPKRSILGERFTNGFSDHFPIFIDLYF